MDLGDTGIQGSLTTCLQIVKGLPLRKGNGFIHHGMMGESTGGKFNKMNFNSK